MGALQNKIDFSVIVTVHNANPNGDPLNGNRPRETDEGFGEISDVCIKRKIRNRLQDMGERIFVQSDDRCDDGFGSLRIRAEENDKLKALGKKPDRNQYIKTACNEWIDVRSFGQVFAFSGDSSDKGSSIPVRGPVSIHIAQTVSPIEIVSYKISSSVNNKIDVFKEGLDKNRLGDKHFVVFGLYVIHGSINCQLAEKTGFTMEDADKIKNALCTLFENDVSSARPEGSMEVCRVYWWEHASKMPKYSSAQIHRSLKINLKEGIRVPKSFADYQIELENLNGAEPEVIDLV